MDKDKLKALIKSGTLDEKLRVVVDDKVNRIVYKKGIVSQKDLQDIFDSVADDDVEAMNDKIEAINKVIKKRQHFELFATKLDYLAEYINSGLERIDIYVMEAYFLNSLLGDIKPLKEKEPKIYNILNRRISLQKSIDKWITLDTDKETKAFSVNASKLEKQLKIALSLFNSTLTSAKTISLVLERFAKEHKIESLIPYDIEDWIESYKSDYSRNKRFSGKNYKKLLSDNSDEALFLKVLMEDNGDIDFVFPVYEDIEIGQEVLDKLVIFS